MLISWDTIISRANVYLDNDHQDAPNWLSTTAALTIAQAEYRQLYRRWIRSSLIAPPWKDFPFTGYTCIIDAVPDGTHAGVLCTIGIAEDLLNGAFRVLDYGQSKFGRSPTYGYFEGKSSYWYATGAADTITYTLEPRDYSGSYFVRYIPVPPLTSVSSDSIDVPVGCDERLVLGVARRAGLKDRSASALLERLIADADAELNFAAAGRTPDGPRVRRIPRFPLPTERFPMAPTMWAWH